MQILDRYDLLKYWMQRVGLSQREICRQLDLSPPTVNGAINGGNDTTFSRIVNWFIDRYPESGLSYESFFPIDTPWVELGRKMDVMIALLQQMKKLNQVNEKE